MTLNHAVSLCSCESCHVRPLFSQTQDRSPQSISKHRRIRHHVPTGKAGVPAVTRPCVSACVCVDVRFCVKWSLWGIDSSCGRPLRGVCPGVWWPVMVCRRWFSHSMAKSSVCWGGDQEPWGKWRGHIHTFTQTHTHATFEESNRATILDIKTPHDSWMLYRPYPF